MAQLALEAQLCLAARFASWGLNVGPWWLISWGTGRMWECPGLHHSPHPTGCVFSKDSRLPCIPFPTPISCLFSCPFPLFLCLKEECSLILCALPIPSCLALPWPLPQVSPKFPGMVLPPQLPCNITPAMLLLLLEGTTAKPCSSRGDRATSQLGGGLGAPITHTAAKPIYTSPCGCLDGEMSGDWRNPGPPRALPGEDVAVIWQVQG